MKKLAIITALACFAFIKTDAQTLKLDYFTKVPTNFKDCGSLYVYDSISLAKKKYIFLADLQNQAMITVAGKQVKLTLSDSKTVGQTNISTYTGSGYTLVLSVKTTNHTATIDTEAGTMQITKGTKKMTLKVHGQTACDESKQEGNSE